MSNEAVSKIENLTYPKRITSDGNDALAWVEKEKYLSIAFLGNGNIAWMYQDGQNEEFSFLDDLKNFLEEGSELFGYLIIFYASLMFFWEYRQLEK